MPTGTYFKKDVILKCYLFILKLDRSLGALEQMKHITQVCHENHAHGGFSNTFVLCVISHGNT